MKLLVSKEKSAIEVAIELDLATEDVLVINQRYQCLRNLEWFNSSFEQVKGNIGPYIHLFNLMNGLGMTPEQVAQHVSYGNNLPYLRSSHSTLSGEVRMLESQKQHIQSQLNFMQNQIEDHTRLLKYYEDEWLAKKNEISSLNYEKDTKKDFIQNLDNDEGYIRIKQAAKKEIKLIMQDFRMTSAVTLSATLEAIRRYPDSRMLIFDIVESQSYSKTQYQQPWMETHTPQLLQLIENVQNEIAEQITGMVVSTMKSISPSRDSKDVKMDMPERLTN